MKSKVGFYKPQAKVKPRFRDELEPAPRKKKSGGGKALMGAGAILGIAAGLAAWIGGRQNADKKR